MEISPFPYHGPLEPEQVQGRDELVVDLTERVTERRVTALLGPRRYGKTSVLRRVAADLTGAGTSAVWIDLYEVASLVDVALRLEAALTDAQGPARRVAARIAAGLHVDLGLLQVRLERRGDRPDPEALVHSRLDILVRAALEQPTVLVFDEFSDIARVPGFAGLLRSRLQAHFQEVGLLFAGSEPSTMQTLFDERAEPFYAQADLVVIDPLSPVALHEIVSGGFERSGRDPGSLAALIADFTGGHPQRSMQLADAAWRVAEPGRPWSQDVWDEGLERVRRASAAAYERLYAAFENGEKDVLRVLAGGGAIFGRAAELLSLRTGTAQNARDRLVAGGEVLATTEGHQVTDPLLADWIRHRFPI